MFLVVCGAVSHAHRNLVVHRDLKPRNILVTKDGDPKLLDFGIATVLNPELSGDSVGTRLAFTPEYASPEQIQNQSVSTAADVYSLGVVLYELLTRRSPYRLKTRTPSEIFQAVCEQQPDLPSAAAGRTSRAPPPTRRRRRTRTPCPRAPVAPPAPLEGRSRHHPAESAAQGAAPALSLGRGVRRRPPPVPRRQTGGRSPARPWPIARGSSCGVTGCRPRPRPRSVLTLVVGSAALAVQARRLAQERDKSERIAGFLKELFNVADPSRSRGNSVTAREILDEGVKKSTRRWPTIRRRAATCWARWARSTKDLASTPRPNGSAARASTCTAPRSVSRTRRRIARRCSGFVRVAAARPLHRCGVPCSSRARRAAATLGDDHAADAHRPRTGSAALRADEPSGREASAC